MTQQLSREFTEGLCRNEQDAVRSHIYERFPDGSYAPMCGYGWNRSNGTSFSIFRGHTSARGTCQLCQRNLKAGKPAVRDGWPHKTKWI